MSVYAWLLSPLLSPNMRYVVVTSTVACTEPSPDRIAWSETAPASQVLPAPPVFLSVLPLTVTFTRLVHETGKQVVGTAVGVLVEVDEGELVAVLVGVYVAVGLYVAVRVVVAVRVAVGVWV